jgi:EAL domain-containing protein (putative c-di-GMP-specific phosphodiesterase class I)
MARSSTVTPMTSAVALLEAIDSDELRLHYQAIHSLPDCAVVGYEALIRWEHPQLGLLQPDEFLPADMGGGIGWALTNFVLEAALAQCARWRRGGRDLGVSVNISPGPLADELLPLQVLTLLERHHVPRDV